MAETLRPPPGELSQLQADLSWAREQIVELWSVVARLQQGAKRRRRQTRADDAALVRHLHGHFGERTFRAADVLGNAYVGALFSSSSLTAERVGRRLSALADKPPAGPYRVERVVRDAEGWVWTIVIVTISVDSLGSNGDHSHNDDSGRP